MTGPEDSQGTRPISVAELLARNGTIGAPPVGGRRRRRRGDTDSISVAELTGEIPIVTDQAVVEQPVAEQPTVIRPVVVEPDVEPAVVEQDVEEPAEPIQASTNGAVDRQETDVVETVETAEAAEAAEAVEATEAVEAAEAVEAVEALEAVDEDGQDVEDETDDDYADAVAEYTAHIQQRDTDEDLDFFAPPRRSSYAPRRFGALVDAEEMSPDPDPVDDDTVLDWSDTETEDDDVSDIEALDTVGDLQDDAKASDSSSTSVRPATGALFGGQTVADDLARKGTSSAEDVELDDRAEPAPAKTMSSFMHGVWIVGQCILAVAFGAGLFVAFDQLWKWNNIVALVLSVLVILGLVVGVRVVRKTEDIGSTLIAVAVGALVTLGPLALLQSG